METCTPSTNVDAEASAESASTFVDPLRSMDSSPVGRPSTNVDAAASVVSASSASSAVSAASATSVATALSAAATRAALALSCATWVGMSTGTFCLAGSSADGSMGDSADGSTCESAGDSAGSSAGEIAGCSAAAFALPTPSTPSTPSTRRTRSRAPHTQCACLPLICTPHVRRAVIGRFAAMVLFLCFNLAYVS